MKKMTERCRNICGGDRGSCFSSNDKQLTCISDMIINKAAGIKAIIEYAQDPSQQAEIDEVLKLATRDLNELINWVFYLKGQGRVVCRKSLGVVAGRAS